MRSDAPVIRVAIVDDHPIVRAGLAALLKDEPDLCVCGEGATPLEAAALAIDVHPDVMLVDISLGIESGMDVIRLLGDRLAIVVVSIHRDSMWVERSLAAGAKGYVHKSDAAQDVVCAIRSVHGGERWVSPSIAEGDPELLGVPAAIQAGIATLSARELEVLERIGRGLSTREIASALGLSPKTVQTYREHLKDKLNCRTGAELATRAASWIQRSL